MHNERDIEQVYDADTLSFIITGYINAVINCDIKTCLLYKAFFKTPEFIRIVGTN